MTFRVGSYQEAVANRIHRLVSGSASAFIDETVDNQLPPHLMKAPDPLPRHTLRHLHLPGLTPYLHASFLQSLLVRHHLSHKALPVPAKTATPPPAPTLLTFQTPPTYTCGRREIGHLTSSQITHLRANGAAEFHEALRGGQTTFHGPGQLTAYLILALDAHALTPRRCVLLLEDAVIKTCATAGDIKGFRTENPGVWVSRERKIASVGLHLRRNVSSHGIGLNVSVDLGWFDRIVACGLPEKRATSFEREGVAVGKKGDEYIAEVATIFATTLIQGLGNVDGVLSIGERDIVARDEETE